MPRNIVLLKSAKGPLEITEAAWKNARSEYEALGYSQATAAEVTEHTGAEAAPDEAAQEEAKAPTKKSKAKSGK
ncbi:hypothetical protein LEM8419_03559 [Neolewinella maritima]|uniref:Uncharacterized protein n=1 Tax=Neolewinella maritima TaxID=1383882 RepID=A0ABN8FE60_9BACT|nr:hypothetical protein [Neolewinella maritima]CAH1002687.1 hypothetical protein LEM8419_03559 [Neolewinella maritima]